MTSTHYQLLGVSPSASADEIKKRYKKLAIKYHPDKTEDKSHHELFLRISEAYTTLIDSKLRLAYDSKVGVLQSFSYSRTTQSSSGSAAASFRYKTDDYSSPFRYPRGSATDTFRNGYHPSYFDFFRLSTRGTPESRDRESRYKTSAEEDSILAAKLAQRKMKEAMERRRQEFVEEAQRQKRAEEERIRQEMNDRHARAAASAANDTQDRYEWRKFQAHRSAWNPSSSAPDTSGDPEEPIVVEDEDDGEVSSGQALENDSDSVEEFQSPHEFDDDQKEPPLHNNGDESFASANSSMGSGSKHIPEIVEVPEESDAEASKGFFPKPMTSPLRSPPGSPRRMAREAAPHIKAQISKSINDRMNQAEKGEPLVSSHNSAKKAKLSNFDAMKASLGTDLDDVDFSDIRETLPDSRSRSPRRMPSNASIPDRPNKKAKVSEFVDGNSRAQTLFTPVNTNYAKKQQGTITVSDLTPQTDDSMLIFNCSPPQVELTEKTSKETWLAYVDSINKYQQAFTAYREAVLDYQVNRLKKDVRHHNIIYSDSSCLDVYQQCLFNDVLLLQNFNRAMHEFRETIKTFNSNSVKVRSGALDFLFGL